MAGQELLPYLKVNKKICRMLPTESVEVTQDDLRRFRMYDAYTGQTHKKSVITYVICSGKAGNIQSTLPDGLNPYYIIPLQMKQEDADTLFLKLKGKAAAGKTLTKQDLAPLMSGHSAMKDRLLEARQLLNMDNSRLNKAERQNMEGVLYAFACKFLNKEDLDEELTLVKSICEAAAKCAPEYNSEEIYRILKAAKE